MNKSIEAGQMYQVIEPLGFVDVPTPSGHLVRTHVSRPYTGEVAVMNGDGKMYHSEDLKLQANNGMLSLPVEVADRIKSSDSVLFTSRFAESGVLFATEIKPEPIQ